MRRSNLPKPLTSFIGREKEIQQVGQLASSARLVTITGSGGVGKTRLAIQVASALAPQYTDGAWWVELAPLFYTSILGKSNDPQQPGGLQNVNHRNLQVPLQEHSKVDLVTQAVAKVLRVPDVPGQPELEGIVELLHDKKTLLVLDNCEHLVDECAFLVQRLLADCPELTFLTTSREALGVPGERPWLLPSLSLPERKLTPETDALFQSEAVKLFVERTADVMPGYEPDKLDASIIAQICLRLDGIPLAIELAAARMSMLSAQEIANRLDHRFSLLTGGQRTALPRHKTLRAAIEWSYELLSKSEQILFRRLSIFSGSFTLEAAEAICTSQEIHDDEVLSLLGRLVDKSLVIVDPAPYGSGQPSRYRYLDTIHGFGQLKLDEAVETRWMRDRHAGYYVHLVEIAEPELLLKNQNYWYNLLRAENDNIRAAVEWSAESNQSEAGLRLVGALSWFYFRSGSTREGIDLVQKALTLPSAYQFKEARARALNFAGFLHYLIGEPEMARRSLVEAQSIFRELGDEASLAWSLQFMGLVLAFEKEYDLADAAFEEGLAYTRKLGNQLANTFLHFHGDIDLEKGDISRAKRIYEESANYLRNIGNKSFLAYPLRRLGYLALQQNDLRTASRYFLESLEYNRETGDMPGLTASLVSLAALATHQDRPVIAACLYGNVENRLESVSANLLHLDRAELVRIRSALPAYLDQAAFTAIFTEGWKMSEIQAIQYAETTFAGDD